MPPQSSHWCWSLALGVSLWAVATAGPRDPLRPLPVEVSGSGSASLRRELEVEPNPLPAALTPSERGRIQKENDAEDHVEACLEVGSARLTQAQGALAAEDYAAAEESVGTYDQLLTYTFRYAQGAAVKPKKRDKMYRKMETTLRRQIAVLEAIKCETPDSPKYSAAATLAHARDMRRQLLNQIFGSEFLTAG